jgi:heat shock protein HslJ
VKHNTAIGGGIPAPLRVIPERSGLTLATAAAQITGGVGDSMRSVKWLGLASCVLTGLAAPAAAQDLFPFDSELIMDVAPMRGSKKIPNMDVDPKGGIAMEMWCNRIEGQFVVAADTVTVLTGQATQRQCPPERAAGDEQLLAALGQVTNWRRRGDTLELTGGPRPLKFKVPTN